MPKVIVFQEQSRFFRLYGAAPPGRIAPEVIAALDELSSERRLYGQWRRQIRLAAGIAECRAAR